MHKISGLNLAQEFYKSQQSALHQLLPQWSKFWALGLVGEGSECFGFDDAWSQDHDWGPGFCIWLQEAQLALAELEIKQALSQLPKTFQGFATRLDAASNLNRVGVLSIETFYTTFINLPRLPLTWQEWRVIPEHFLAVATNGVVFEDNLGEFTRIRQGLLDFYPEDVRLKKIAARCMNMAQAGQYNLLRSLKRQEITTAMLCAARFAEQALSMVYLLNKKYMPFYKWAHRGVKQLPILGELTYNSLQNLSCLPWQETRQQETRQLVALAETTVEELCIAIATELRRQELSEAPGAWLLDHGPRIQAKIKTPQLLAMPVMLE